MIQTFHRQPMQSKRRDELAGRMNCYLPFFGQEALSEKFEIKIMIKIEIKI